MTLLLHLVAAGLALLACLALAALRLAAGRPAATEELSRGRRLLAGLAFFSGTFLILDVILELLVEFLTVPQD